MPVKDSSSRWNCNLRLTDCGETLDFIGGFRQLAKATGLSKHISKSLMQWLDAMYCYRNHMFHMGFEWDDSKKNNFKRMIAEKAWGDYFSLSTTGNDPWMFYISKDTIERSPDLKSEFLDSLASFCKGLPEEFWSQHPSNEPKA